MSKLVPSPDWFVGLDGLNLCENGKFVDSVTVEVHTELRKSLCKTYLSRTQAGPGRAVKEQQEQILPNHMERIFLCSTVGSLKK